MRFAAFAPMFGLVVTASCSAIDDVRAVAGPVPRAELEGRASPEGSALARASRAASDRARAMGAEARARATAIEQERARAEQERAEHEAAERAARDALATAGTDWDGFGATVAPRDDGADDDVGSIESDEASADGFAKLASRAREAWIYAEPKAKSRRLGYLRAGAVVDRDAQPAGRIVCKGSVIQHWLNGEKVVDFDYTNPKWAAEVELLRLRGGNLSARGAFLSLQDHGDLVWYRSIRLRTIPESEKLQSENITPGQVPEAMLEKEKHFVETKQAAERQKAGK
jgi:hypothetical protein